MKVCFKCNSKKPLSEYYKHPQMGDGHLNKCKECTKKDSNKNREDNLDYYLEYDKKRANLPHRLAQRKEYKKTDAGKITRGRALRKWEKNNRHKKNAHMKVQRAIIKGTVIRQPCFCGKKAEAHHEDYSKPLDVVWLCDFHHKERHKEIRNDQNMQ